jgi:chemotaxis protein CheD
MASPNPAETVAPTQVGLAEVLVSRDPMAALHTGPLGAGLAVAIFDPEAKIGGLLHALLPDSKLDPAGALARPALFVDTGLAALFEAAEKLGAKPDRFVLCAAGAANIMDEGSDFDLGGQMSDALHAWLKARRQRLHAEEIGETANRSLRLNLALGQFRVIHVSGLAEHVLCRA